jgi:hypothetical protein
MTLKGFVTPSNTEKAIQELVADLSAAGHQPFISLERTSVTQDISPITEAADGLPPLSEESEAAVEFICRNLQGDYNPEEVINRFANELLPRMILTYPEKFKWIIVRAAWGVGFGKHFQHPREVISYLFSPHEKFYRQLCRAIKSWDPRKGRMSFTNYLYHASDTSAGVGFYTVRDSGRMEIEHGLEELPGGVMGEYREEEDAASLDEPSSIREDIGILTTIVERESFVLTDFENHIMTLILNILRTTRPKSLEDIPDEPEVLLDDATRSKLAENRAELLRHGQTYRKTKKMIEGVVNKIIGSHFRRGTKKPYVRHYKGDRAWRMSTELAKDVFGTIGANELNTNAENIGEELI